MYFYEIKHNGSETHLVGPLAGIYEAHSDEANMTRPAGSDLSQYTHVQILGGRLVAAFKKSQILLSPLPLKLIHPSPQRSLAEPLRPSRRPVTSPREPALNEQRDLSDEEFLDRVLDETPARRRRSRTTRQLNELVRALDAGEYNSAPGQLVQGGPLQVEPLDITLRDVEYRNSWTTTPIDPRGAVLTEEILEEAARRMAENMGTPDHVGIPLRVDTTPRDEND